MKELELVRRYEKLSNEVSERRNFRMRLLGEFYKAWHTLDRVGFTLAERDKKIESDFETRSAYDYLQYKGYIEEKIITDSECKVVIKVEGIDAYEAWVK
ncbi:hypothetical protein [Bacillus sp. JJ722]|uniref:hypothetical protein n=1 Tax=Bacillus sp. JJ722 TaxID=3122973 RepID=UPI003000D0DE